MGQTAIVRISFVVMQPAQAEACTSKSRLAIQL
jgi:hypothetical protein